MMAGKLDLLFLSAVFLSVPASLTAENMVVPAGTILQCTLNDPNLSPKTTAVGDPILCDADPLYEFGVPVFPQGAYLKGHITEAAQPGHFWGKGSMHVSFDQILLPGAELPMGAKITEAPHVNVDAHGTMHGKGHATRDTVEWMIPVLWPMKVITLPMRGPQPQLKSEARLSLKLMRDVIIPDGAAGMPTGRRLLRPGVFQSTEPPQEPRYAISTTHLVRPEEPVLITRTPQPTVAMVPAAAGPVADRTTFLILKDGTGQLARQYWFESGQHIRYIAPDGSSGLLPIEALDFASTVKLNRERGVDFVIQSRGPEPSVVPEAN
jgi:hypothetical protein